ncbi:MAG: DNA polymerase beta superfamily protein [Culicoidibacterales bacterium]
MQVVAKLIFGSRLYGTSTPNSDTDYKLIVIPSSFDILMGNGRRSIVTSTSAGQNTSVDVDCETFTLHKFIDMLCVGETAAIEMINAPAQNVLETSDVWRYLQAHRQEFCSQKMNAFLGYVNTQARKYGARGSRLVSLEAVIDEINMFTIENQQNMTIREFIDLGAVTFGQYVSITPAASNGEVYLDVIGIKTDLNMSVATLAERMRTARKKYGARSVVSAQNGADWKSISHAYRVATQLIELAETSALQFPLKRRDIIRSLKLGEIPFDTAMVMLDNVIQEAESKFDKAAYHEIDKDYWLNYCATIYRETVVNQPLHYKV